MSKIYEALEREEQQRTKVEQQFLEQRTETRSEECAVTVHDPRTLCGNNGDKADEEFISLYYSIDTLTGLQKNSKVIQFVSSINGEGTSTIVEEFGRNSAWGLGKSVLVLRPEQKNGHRELPGHDSDHPVSQNLARLGSEEEVYQKRGEACFFVWSLSDRDSIQTILSTSRFERVLAKLREHFDLILLDTPSISTSPIGLAVCSQVDGVILVVEAERTKSRFAQSVKAKLERAGGNILGVVLNKHRTHIPDKIDQYL